jgi:AcrR family transcriptional regulator
MGRPRQVSDEQILAAMRDGVLAQGPNVSLEVVAEQLGVTVPAILKRYGSRQALMIAALRPPQAPWIEGLAVGPSNAPLEEQLQSLFQQMSDFMIEAIPRLTALRESGIPMQAYADVKAPDRGIKAIQKWLAEARKRGLVTAAEIESAAYAIASAVQGRFFIAHMSKASLSPRAQRQYITELAAFFARALAPSASQRSVRPLPSTAS